MPGAILTGVEARIRPIVSTYGACRRQQQTDEQARTKLPSRQHSRKEGKGVAKTGVATQQEVVLQVPASWGEIFKMEEGDGEREKSQEKNPA